MKIVFEQIASKKEFADQCWRDNPRISADAWRDVWLGTVARMWLDGRQSIVPDAFFAAHSAGANGIVVSADQWPQVRAVMADKRAEWAAFVLVDPHTEAINELVGADAWLWAPQGSVPSVDDFAFFEAAVRDGLIAGYGVVLDVSGDHNMAAWWEIAKDAAALAWGRRKKPSWRVLVGPVGVGQDSLLHKPCCKMGDELVSVIEWAVRMGVMVLADHADKVFGPLGEPLALRVLLDDERVEAARVVERLALLEQRLMVALGGWPLRDDVPVFSVLMHLQHGIPLWPSMPAWQRWWGLVWPSLNGLWQQIAQQRPDYAGLIEEYRQALAGVSAHDELLMAAGAEQWHGGVMQWLRREHPFNLPAWQPVPDHVLRAVLVASLPGVVASIGHWHADDVAVGMACNNVVGVDVFFGDKLA